MNEYFSLSIDLPCDVRRIWTLRLQYFWVTHVWPRETPYIEDGFMNMYHTIVVEITYLLHFASSTAYCCCIYVNRWPCESMLCKLGQIHLLLHQTHARILYMLTEVFFFLFCFFCTTQSGRKCPKLNLNLLFPFVQTAPSHAFLMRTLACYVSRLEQLSEYFVGFSFVRVSSLFKSNTLHGTLQHIRCFVCSVPQGYEHLSWSLCALH